MALALCDGDASTELKAYVEEGCVLPPGLLPSCILLIQRMELCAAVTSGNLYGRLTALSTVTAFRCAAHNFDGRPEVEVAERATTAMAAGAGLTVGAAGVRAGGGSSPAVITPCGVGGRTSAAGRGGGSSMGNLVSSGGALLGSCAVASRILMRSGGAGAGSGSGAGIGGQGRQLTASGVSDGASAVDSPRLSQASVLSRSTPVLLHDLGPYGPPLPGLLKLVVTIKEVYEVSLYLTCCQCEDTRVGGSCRCTKARAANLHAEAKVGVTDGTGIATLVAKGRCLWALLQCSPATIDCVRAAVEASGPLSCRSQNLAGGGKRECLSFAGGLWRCGPGLNISDAHRRALDAMWPSLARECVVHCGCPGRPAVPAVRSQGVRVSKATVPMLHLQPDEGRSRHTLVATDLTPLVACDLPGELERALTEPEE